MDDAAEDRKRLKALMRSVDKARNFPTNTCPYSRHAQMIGEALVKGKRYAMLEEEPDHCGESILATVEALYKSRTEVDQLRAKLRLPSRLTEALVKMDTAHG